MTTISVIKYKAMPYMAYEQQQKITRLCIRCGLLLMQYGADSADSQRCRKLNHE